MMKMPETQFYGTRASFGRTLLLSLLVMFGLSGFTPAQQKEKTPQGSATPALLTRTTTRHEVRRLGFGSAITILGAPSGSITIEGWNKSEVDITADIELQANTEEDLARLAVVNTFAVVKDGNRLNILTTGTHDKKYMKNVAKDFPKALLGLPWKIDYHIRVPMMCDLDIDAGRGAISLTNVDGAIGLRAVESEAQLTLSSGMLMATVALGKVTLNVPVRSWRGRGVEIRLASGDLTVQLPTGFSADINAEVLRTGKIENSYAGLTPREDTVETPRNIKGRTGAGGTVLVFTVGDGTISIKNRDK